jgi:hypothetical protein
MISIRPLFLPPLPSPTSCSSPHGLFTLAARRSELIREEELPLMDASSSRPTLLLNPPEVAAIEARLCRRPTLICYNCISKVSISIICKHPYNLYVYLFNWIYTEFYKLNNFYVLTWRGGGQGCRHDALTTTKNLYACGIDKLKP